MNKSDIIKEVSLTTEVKEDTVRKVFNGIIESINDNLFKGIDVKIQDLLSLKLEISPEKERYDFKTGSNKILPAHYRIKATVSRKLKERIATKTVYDGRKNI